MVRLLRLTVAGIAVSAAFGIDWPSASVEDQVVSAVQEHADHEVGDDDDDDDGDDDDDDNDSSGDSIAPNVEITGPSTDSVYFTYEGSIDLSGTSSDNDAVIGIHWLSDSGEQGSAAGTTSWLASGLPLYPGPNLFTITAQDAAGNTGSDTIIVVYLGNVSTGGAADAASRLRRFGPQ